jgi:phage shock protein E
MSKTTSRGGAVRAGTGAPASTGNPAPRTPGRSRREEEMAIAARRKRNSLLVRIAGAIVAVAVVAVVAIVALGGNGGGSSAQATSTPQATSGAAKTWTNISADQLASMMNSKDFTLLNVKTPYIGEIDGTDLYIPYNLLTVRSTQLPADKGAKIVVYCRSGVESAQAAQTLLDMGYTNIWNLTGGMNAWTASGRAIVQKNRG